MNSLPWKNHLGVKLVISVLLSFLAAFCVFTGVRYIAYDVLDHLTQDSTLQTRHEQQCADRLQAYVTKNKVALSDRDALDRWIKAQKYVGLTLVRDKKLLYDSSIPRDGNEDYYAEYYEETASEYPWLTYYTIAFTDGEAQAQIYCFYEWRYYSAINITCALLSFLVFITLFLLIIRRKIAYIKLLEEELKILEGGDLAYAVTERGSDELGALARGINDMRQAIIDRQNDEEQARTANHALVTAMSHDLRTPLTALIGYLDIIALGRYSGEQQFQHFVQSSRQKAYQIKELSDKLFEYFLVYDKEANCADFQIVDCLELFQQTIGEGLFELESQGFCVEPVLPEIHCALNVNVDLFRRVIDNLFSNIVKYADTSRPVSVSYRLEAQTVCVVIANFVDRTKSVPESTGIGLKTCQKIIQDHDGAFSCKSEGDLFSVSVQFPAFQ